MAEITVYKNRTNVKQIHLGYDVSGDIITSQVRAKKEIGSLLLFTWTVSLLTDGVDGKLVISVDDSALTDITVKHGYMDLKRMSAGEPLQVFDAVKVHFRESITA